MFAGIENSSMPELLNTGQDLLIFLLFTPLISEREWNTTLMCMPVPSTSNASKYASRQRVGENELLVNVGRVSNSIDSLKYRCNVACISLCYRHYNRFCLSIVGGLIPKDHVFLLNTRLSR